MKKLIVLNHKMNLDYDEVIPYINDLNKIETTNDLIVCPSNIYLTDFLNYCNHGIGGQNIFYEVDGNYTGEVSGRQLKSMGVEYSIVGHYERRKYFNEDNEIINKKVNACIDSNIIPILCFGSSGEIDDVLDELRELLKGIERIEFIIFAYEPLKVDNDLQFDEIKSNIEEIYNYLYDMYEVKPTVIYGGGVANKDVKKLLTIDELSGLLIGKISSNIDDVSKLIKDIG